MIKAFLVAAVLVIILRESILEVYRIPTMSMVPTLLPGEVIYVNKLAYGVEIPLSRFFTGQAKRFGEMDFPRRGDVISFHYERDSSRWYIKRVVGLPGDHVALREGRLFINDKAVSRKKLNPEENAHAYESLRKIESLENGENALLFEESLPGMKDSYRILMRPDSKRFLEMLEKKVPEKHFFVLGDNRNAMVDSRLFGMVPIENVTGKARLVFLSVAEGDRLFRFNRIGEAVE